MSQPPGYCSRYGGPNNIVIVPTVSFSSNTQIPPQIDLQKMDASTEGTEQNVPSDEITKNAIMEQPKATLLSENPLNTTLDQLESKPMSEQLQPISLEHNLKPSPEKLSNEDVNKNLATVVDLNKAKKINSWASNYLQSIGNNNIKPIKITLASTRNKLERFETITTTSNESIKTTAQQTLLKDAKSSYEAFNMTDNPFEFSEPNEKIISEHINVENIKTVHPTEVNADEHPKMPPAFSMSDNITSAPVTSNIALDTIYTNNYSNGNAPAYTSLLKCSGEALYCYNDGKREIDILDAIKSKIDHESAIEQKSRMMNLPTHKDMCEEFIKEITCNKQSSSEMKRHRSKSSTPAKIEELVRHQTKHSAKLETKAKKLEIKYNMTSDEQAKKSKCSSSGKEKTVVNEKKVDHYYYKQQISKPLVNIKDFDILTKDIFAKETEQQPKTESHSLERQNLKRVRTSSEDQHSFRSESHTNSPIRSVIKIAENGPSHSPKRQCLNECFDLRSKLSRVNQRIHRKQMENDFNTKPRQRENLKITVENQRDEKQKSPKKSSGLKYKSNKCRKLKLIINVVCQESEDESTSSDSSHNETTHNIDLSFLDDFNVDEIVDSLKHSPNKPKMKSPLPNDSKMEDNTKLSAEPELKLATILNILQAKSESNKVRTLAKTECKIEETMKINSSTICNISEPITVPNVEMYSIHKTEEHAKKINSTENTNDALVKILPQTQLQLNEQKATPFEEVSLKGTCAKKELHVINRTQMEQQSCVSERLITDESVIIYEQEISIVDLTDETVCAASKTNDNAITANPKYIQSERHDDNKLLREKTDKVTNVHNLKDKFKKFVKTLYKMDVETEKAILDQDNETIIDLTNETIGDEIHEGFEHKNTQMDIETESIMKQDIRSIPLPNSDISPSKENKEPVNTKIQFNCSEINNLKNTDIQLKENPTEVIENATPMNDFLSNTKATTAMKPVKMVDNDDTVIILKETNIKNIEEKHQESVESLSIVKGELTKEIKNMSKIFETKAAKKVLKTIVKNVWANKNDLVDTSGNNSETKIEPVNAPKTNTNGSKVKAESNLTGQNKALAELLEGRMLGYLHKEIKVLQHIRLGKYSNIYSYKDSNGETYAAKILKDQNNRHALGICKEQMLRQIQQDIPRENMNTIYLIDGFGIERYWCFLTDYYPKNLLQAMKQQDKPFHIDRVQDLARQLISAVIVLRNNHVIHSDIKPTHILLNSTNDRLKLCGFDEAYYGHDNVHPVPNIGTSNYRAPEIIIGFSAGYSIDVWSSALVIYQMVTNKTLFPGYYNNDILYKQMCTLGNLPRDMVDASLYKNQHFRGKTFMRRVGYRGQDAVLFQKFHKSNRLHMTIITAHTKYWQTNDAYQRDSDIFKLAALQNLLEQMLLLDPRRRLAIEFVCADPFIYEMFM